MEGKGIAASWSCRMPVKSRPSVFHYPHAMCGRFTQKTSSADLARLFGATDRADFPGDRYNVAPTQAVAAVGQPSGGRTIEALRWGLVPAWSDRARSSSRMINARAESLASSSAHWRAFVGGRCIIPADGFYEWSPSPEGKRQPFYITAANGAPIALAGLRATWHDPSGKSEPVHSCTIVTTTPNDVMVSIHTRMPVILSPETWQLWLDPSTDPTELQALLRPFVGELVARPVSTLVHNPVHDGPELIRPVTLGV
jgi:putative SOS response-associated peptidase YedK